MDRQAVDPSLWGRPAWAFLDFVTAGYPDVAMMSERLAMTNFLESLAFALPCERCRVNFRRFAAARPPALAVAGKRELRMWFNDLKQSIKESK
jgi:Erv1 / Alr family